MKDIFITYCSAKKDESLRGTNVKTTPDRLYASSRIRRFIDACRERKVAWAIFSDKYGILFPTSKAGWYDKAPESVTEEEFERLVRDFDQKLRAYDEIYFYYERESFHELYRRLLARTALSGRIKTIEYMEDAAGWQVK